MGNTKIFFPSKIYQIATQISDMFIDDLINYHLLQYELSWEKDAINDLIEKAVLEADCRGVRVLSLGLLNQAGC